MQFAHQKVALANYLDTFLAGLHCSHSGNNKVSSHKVTSIHREGNTLDHESKMRFSYLQLAVVPAGYLHLGVLFRIECTCDLKYSERKFAASSTR